MSTEEPARIAHEQDGAEVAVVGRLDDLEIATSRQGREYATARLVLPDGHVKILVPPVPYEDVGRWLVERSVRRLSGRVDRRDDTVATRLVVDAVAPAPACYCRSTERLWRPCGVCTILLRRADR